jgi:2',3'-cyclic-nucleotide 2'-phosphodiesterase (5'-nucleotidase family)
MKSKDPVLTFDIGDFYSGTIYKLISPSYLLPQISPELEFFNYCKYDAITIVNFIYLLIKF